MFVNSEGLTKQTRLVIVVAAVLVIAAGGGVLYSIQGGTSTVNTTGTSVTITSGTTTGHSGAVDTSKYLGYIPSGYTVAPRSPNSPTFPCPAGMNTQQCQQFQVTC